MQIKVNNTQIYSRTNENTYDFTSVPVVEGRLVLIDISGSKVQIDSMQHKDAGTIYITGRGWAKPIIISETEKIEDGTDAYLNNAIVRATAGNRATKITELGGKKILALPEHFSPEQLQMIVDGRLKDGDKVLVECDGKPIYPGCEGYQCNHPLDPVEYTCDNEKCANGCIKEEFIEFIKLSPHISLYPIEEKMYTLDHFITELKRFGREHILTSQDIHEFKKWFKGKH